MAGKSRELSPQNKRYIELVTSSNRSKSDIVKEIWPSVNIEQKIHYLNHYKPVQKEIERIQEINRYIAPYTEKEVLEGLLKEAREGTKGSDRINAWVWLGKHIGMFKEKQEEKKSEASNITYNIINYNDSKKKVEKKVEGSVISKD